MKAFSRYRENPWLLICIAVIATFFSLGCSSSRSDSGATTNPLAAYEVSTSTSTSTSTIIGDGTTVTPGSLSSPVISVTEDGSVSINGHDNAPLLDNKHVGWQQSNCLTCHNDTTHNPDHNYSDDSLCYLCHGTNGLPGLSDSTPPVLSSVVVSPSQSTVTISWKSDKECVSRLALKTTQGDKMEFPVSTSYSTSHKKTISGLQSATTYYYELTCIDKSGNKTSSSSFSNSLSFQTSAIQEVVITSTNTSTNTDTDTGTEQEGPAFFSNVSVNDRGGGQFLAKFKTREKPDQLYWYMYKEDGTTAYSDDLRTNDSNEYTELCDSYQSPGKYTVKFKALFNNLTNPYWSKAYNITLKE